MTKLSKAVLLTPLLFVSLSPTYAQHHNNNSAYYNGMRSGGRGGDYYNSHDHRYHDDHYHNQNQGGIGPGKGALIGGGWWRGAGSGLRWQPEEHPDRWCGWCGHRGRRWAGRAE